MAKGQPKNSELQRTHVKDYEEGRARVRGELYYLFGHKPLFVRLEHVPSMMVDPRVSFSMQIMKGMITSLSRFYIDMGDAEAEGDRYWEIKQFLIKQVTRFWIVAASRALSAMDWGWFGAEVLYRRDQNGRDCFADLQTFQQQDVYPVTLKGELCGMELRGKTRQHFLGGQKAFWHVHDRDHLRWWGRSRYERAFEPWFELYDPDGGSLAVRRLHFYKNVCQSDIVRHPVGEEWFDGQRINAGEVAIEIAEKIKSGGVLALPSKRDDKNEYVWDLQPRGHAAKDSIEIREHIKDLRREISEGLGISEEIFQAAATGSGFSGRLIPETATRGHLTDVVFWLIHDADQQIFRPLVRRNFQIEPDYEIVPFGLTRDEGEDDGDEQGKVTEAPGRPIPQQTQRRALNRPRQIVF